MGSLSLTFDIGCAGLTTPQQHLAVLRRIEHATRSTAAAHLGPRTHPGRRTVQSCVFVHFALLFHKILSKSFQACACVGASLIPKRSNINAEFLNKWSRILSKSFPKSQTIHTQIIKHQSKNHQKSIQNTQKSTPNGSQAPPC